MDYTELRKRTNFGWNTWNTLNVLSYSHLPEGFTINLCIREYSSKIICESLIGRNDADAEQIFSGKRSYDGSCMHMRLRHHNLELDVNTIHRNENMLGMEYDL